MNLLDLKDEILKDSSTKKDFLLKFLGRKLDRQRSGNSEYSNDYTLHFKSGVYEQSSLSELLLPEKTCGNWFKGQAPKKWIKVLCDFENHEVLRKNIHDNFSTLSNEEEETLSIN